MSDEANGRVPGDAPVVIVMGSASDRAHGDTIARALAGFGIDSEIRIASAHKATRYLVEMLDAYEASEVPRVWVTIAGRSNALSGVVDANVSGPVIACPPASDKFGGMDILSTLRMPGGVAPLLVLEPEAAALAAAKILGVGDPALAATVEAYHETLRERALEADLDAE